MLSAQLKHQRGFSPTWLVCVVTQDYRTYIHPSSWVEKESKHAYTAFRRKLREREDTAKAFKQDWFCVGIYPAMEVHIYFFSHMHYLGEKPRGEISEDQYRSCQNAAKIR